MVFSDDERLAFIGNKVKSASFANYIDTPFISTFRLDCDFYSPTFIENEAAQVASGFSRRTLGELAATLPNGQVALSDGTHDTIEKLGGYRPDGFRLITSGEVSEGFDSKGVFISEDAHRRNLRSEVIGGDLLVAVRGSTSVGVSRVYPESLPTANMNTAAARIRLSKGTDAHWVAAFLNSYIGRLNSLRLANGVNQLNMNMEELAAVPILIPPIEIQEAIGNKIRKAERLSFDAKATYREVLLEIDDFFQVSLTSDSGEIGWLAGEKLTTQRLDAWFNQPKYVKLGEQLAQNRCLSKVSSLCCLVTDQANLHAWPALAFHYFEIGGIDDQLGQIKSTLLNVEDAPSRAKTIVAPWDILVSTVRPNLKNIAIVPETVSHAICSSGFSVLRAPNPSTAGYVWACLTHSVATNQLMRWNSGGTYPAIERNVPMHVWIPSPGEDHINRIGESIIGLIRSNAESVALLSSAKKDIEEIIKGKLGDSGS